MAIVGSESRYTPRACGVKRGHADCRTPDSGRRSPIEGGSGRVDRAPLEVRVDLAQDRRDHGALEGGAADEALQHVAEARGRFAHIETGDRVEGDVALAIDRVEAEAVRIAPDR